MKWYEAAGIGTIMACLYGVVLWASMLARGAYYIALSEIYVPTPDYGAVNTTPMTLEYNTPVAEAYHTHLSISPDPNMVYMPFEVTGIVMIIAFVILFSIPLWSPLVQKEFDDFAGFLFGGRE